MWEELTKQLRDILTANTLLPAVYTFETAEYDGDPFATITPSGNENDFDTTTENERVYAFVVRLFKERSGETQPEDAEAAMRELVDSVLDDFDKNWQLSNVATPTGYDFLYMEAAPSAWGYVDRETQIRIAEITIRCHLHIDTQLIS